MDAACEFTQRKLLTALESRVIYGAELQLCLTPVTVPAPRSGSFHQVACASASARAGHVAALRHGSSYISIPLKGSTPTVAFLLHKP